MTVQLLIADDQEVVRAGLRYLFRETEFQIVEEASSGNEAVRLVTRSKPDLVLLDVRMPDGDGISALRHIKALDHDCTVVMFSAFDNPRFCAMAHAAGAMGYVLKSAPRDELLDTLRQAVAGMPTWRRRGLPQLSEQELQAAGSTNIEFALTPRERQVLVQLCDGLTNKQIAQELKISYETVKEHVQHILHKIGVTDRTQAAIWAVDKGIV